MCGGGGGGGDGGAAQREAARQAKQDEAIAKIDELFGISGAGAAQNKMARNALYGQVRNDVIGYFRPELEKQKTDAERSTRFSLAERGLTGGSVDIDQNKELQDRYLKGVLAVTNKGDAAANEMRGADSRTRLDMISRINAGADAGTAVSSAMNEMAANANSARDQAFGQNLNSFFDDMLFLQRAKTDYLNNQQLQNTFSNYFRAPTGGGSSTGSTSGKGAGYN